MVPRPGKGYSLVPADHRIHRPQTMRPGGWSWHTTAAARRSYAAGPARRLRPLKAPGPGPWKTCSNSNSRPPALRAGTRVWSQWSRTCCGAGVIEQGSGTAKPRYHSPVYALPSTPFGYHDLKLTFTMQTSGCPRFQRARSRDARTTNPGLSSTMPQQLPG